jgi:glycosyltransferase involved in cell wall biosynthesis
MNNQNHDKSLVMISNLTGKMCSGQSVCETLAVLLSSRGWQVYMASSKVNKFARLFDMLYTVWKNRKFYQLGYIEVYSGLGFIWAEILSRLLRILKKPYVLALYGGNLPNFGKRHPRRMQKLLASTNIVLSPSLYIKELMKDFRDNIVVLPYGIDISKYQYRIRNTPKLKLLTMRAFHQIYNLQLAPKVLSLLIDGYEDCAELVMTGANKGDGSFESVIETAQKLKVDGFLNIKGFVAKESLPSIINKVDILLNTTNIDNTPVSVIEAMACGLCIVSTNVGGIPYLLEDGVDSLLVPPDDAQVMAAAVRRVLTEPGLAARLSANARKKAEQYDWSVILPKWEKLLGSLI